MVSRLRRASKGPYRPTRDPQVLLLVAIVVGVVGLWVVGAMSPATLPGGESGPVFPFRDQSEDGVVDVAVNESTVDPGGVVGVTVTVDGKAVSDASVSVAGRSYETDDDGEVVVRLESPGSYAVEATGPEGNRSASTSVRVRRYRTSLVVSVPDGVVTNETVPVRVERADGEPVSASVSVNGRRVSTGPDGVANVSFATAGSYVVRASKPKTESYVFADGTANVSVDRRLVRLDVSWRTRSPEVDESTTVTVQRRDTGEPVNATVDVGNRTVVTGADGRATVAFDVAGRVPVTARANRTPAVRFRPAESSVDVRRIPVDLSVSVSPNPVQEDERATFVVRRSDTGERVDATLSMFGTSYATGPDGRVSFPFFSPVNATVTATKASTPRERFRSADATFVVEGPEIVVESLSVPESVPADESMTVTATLSNVGTADASGDAVVTVGNATTRIPTSVASGGTETVSWTVATPDETGTVTVVVAYEEAVVTRTVRLTGNETTVATATPRTTTATVRD
jgi:hypothetical protein